MTAGFEACINLETKMTPAAECVSEASDKALARKRRIELRQQQRKAHGTSSEEDRTEGSKKRKRPEDDCISTDDSSLLPDETSSKSKPSLTGIKRQARYEPGVPMTKKELTAWRKEARRVRNRLSAAESRKKTRSRIEELEDAMGALQKKYSAAMERILELEKINTDLKNSHQLSTLVSGDDAVVSPPESPLHVLETSQTLPSPFMLSNSPEGNSCQMDIIKNQRQHIIEMISRPQA
mmetsp:Transcript_13928/g.19511  ORF Transcript_13928/g.19511 Transcript_13928/m.19511 type:complete len:237 (+) Transcript_13928:3-713(+)